MAGATNNRKRSVSRTTTRAASPAQAQNIGSDLVLHSECHSPTSPCHPGCSGWREVKRRFAASPILQEAFTFGPGQSTITQDQRGLRLLDWILDGASKRELAEWEMLVAYWAKEGK